MTPKHLRVLTAPLVPAVKIALTHAVTIALAPAVKTALARAVTIASAPAVKIAQALKANGGSTHVKPDALRI